MKKHIKLLAVLTLICVFIFAFAACGTTADGGYGGSQTNGDGNVTYYCPYHHSYHDQHNQCTGAAGNHHSGHGAHHSYHC